MRYAGALTSTDYWKAPLPAAGTPDGSVEYRRLDAHDLDEEFTEGSYDLVFSSNMLEHIDDPQVVLAGVRHVLRDGGLSIHVMPSPFWKLAHLCLYPAARLRGIVRRVRASGVRSRAFPTSGRDTNNPEASTGIELFWPRPHGAGPNNRSEFRAFSRQRWRKEFTGAGFTVLAEIRGPVASGYGFGLDTLRTWLERTGFTSEVIYVTRLRGGSPSPYESLLNPAPTAP
jgi:SAM-dependent methyltransferase